MDRQLKVVFEQAMETLRQVETLLAWRELEISERRVSSDLWLSAGSTTPQDLKVQLGRFFALFFSIHEYVETRPRAVRRKPAEMLQKLWGRFRALELRVAKPGVIPSGA